VDSRWLHWPTAGGQSHSQIKGKVDIENPLLRSGILLAGAQHSLTNGTNGHYDGIVTAEEILGMNLHGTEMVVLSACDTGLGDVKSGEGVFGLRRAFTQSGAKSLVMSLWKVPDKETKELMVQFYRNIKSGKMNRCQSLRQAILKEKEIVRQRYGHDNPRYWGAFVFMGQP
jgi:CHAT domain-containing protein